MNRIAQADFERNRGLLLVFSFTFAVATSSPIGLCQQWPIGHQPTPYSVPQYRPSSGPSPQNTTSPRAYPLYESTTQEPGSTETLPPTLPREPVISPIENDPAPAELPTPRAIDDPTPIQPVPTPAQSAPDASTLIEPLPRPALGPAAANPSPTPPARSASDFSIYRDPNPYPIDPRKPCNECSQPAPAGVAPRHSWPGRNGRPYQEREPGGCQCSSASCKAKPNFNLNWPAPFSAKLGNHLSGDPCEVSRKRINDRFDHLADFKLIDYQRTDNGHCGLGSDPYGCLGESRYGN